MSSTEVSAKPLSASSSRAAFSIASTVVIRDVRLTAASSDDMGPFIPPRLDAPGRGVAPLEQARKRLPAPAPRHRGHASAGQVDLPPETGRASCRERVFKYVQILVIDGP